MKAVVFDEHGDLDQIQYADIPEPEVGANDVRVEIRAAALNRLDLWVLEGWPGLKLKMPHIMGADGAGIVREVGTNVTAFAPGDRVSINPTLSCGECEFCRSGRDNMCPDYAILGEHVDGVFAEYAALPARNLLKMPDEVLFTDAAAASLVFVTAWHSLITRGQLRAGESVLIVGAAGGVNTAAVQIARFAGAGPIYVVGSSSEKLSLAEELGADVLINRSEGDWGRALYKATNRKGVDVVVDNVGAASYMMSLRALKRGGRMLTVGNTSGPKFEMDNRYMFGKHLSIIGSTMGPRSDYEQVMNLIFEGRLRPIVDTVYPMRQAISALRRLESGDVLGKLVLQP